MALVDSVREDMCLLIEGRQCNIGWAFAKTVSNNWEMASSLCIAEIAALMDSDNLRVNLDCLIMLALKKSCLCSNSLESVWPDAESLSVITVANDSDIIL